MQAIGGLISPISQMFLARKQRREANKINPIREFYKTSQHALDNKSLAQSAYNGRMAGAGAMEQGINTAQANMIASANRNATSSADALAVAAASQGVANDSFGKLATMEAQNKEQQLAGVMRANDALTQEGEKVYNDKLLYYNDLDAKKQSLLQAATANRQSGWQGIGNALMMAGSTASGSGSSGGFGGFGEMGASPTSLYAQRGMPVQGFSAAGNSLGQGLRGIPAFPKFKV